MYYGIGRLNGKALYRFDHRVYRILNKGHLCPVPVCGRYEYRQHSYYYQDYQKALAAKKIVHYLLLIVTPREKLPTAAIYKLIIKLR